MVLLLFAAVAIDFTVRQRLLVTDNRFVLFDEDVDASGVHGQQNPSAAFILMLVESHAQSSSDNPTILPSPFDLVDEAHIPLNPRTSGAVGEEENREEDTQLQALLIHDATMLSWIQRPLYIRNEKDERPRVMSSVKRILIIDDEKEITDGLKVGLEGYEFHVDTYNNPLEAISRFKPGTYHLAIIDVRMPEMNGFDVYRNLKKMDRDMKVCFFTAYDVYEEGFRGMFPELRSDCFLRKPMSISGMARAITQLLDAEPGPK